MKFSPKLEPYRIRHGQFASDPGDDFGAFIIPAPYGSQLKVIASSGDKDSGVDWEHVSVSTPKRNPNWREMCYIKRLFWDDEETVMQLHPPESKGNYILNYLNV